MKAQNIMTVAGQLAVISYVPEIGMFRGKFLVLSGYCDFISDSIQGYPESFGEQLHHAAAEHQVSVNAFIIESLNEQMK